MSELWKDIPEWDGLYQASSEGRVRSLDRQVSQPGFTRAFKGQVLTQMANPVTGYLQVNLARGGKRKTCRVHCLVAAAFLGPRPAGADVAHLDGNRHNNQASNFIYASRAENFSHKVGHGTLLFGERHGQAKISEAQARKAIAEVESGRSQSAVARDLGVHPSSVCNLMRGATWARVTGHSSAGGCHL